MIVKELDAKKYVCPFKFPMPIVIGIPYKCEGSGCMAWKIYNHEADTGYCKKIYKETDQEQIS